jgi:drug/metabolite transporter (DMT)-like permease
VVRVEDTHGPARERRPLSTAGAVEKGTRRGGRRLAILALVATMFVWGSSFALTQLVLGEAGPFAVTAMRFGLGLLVLLPFARRRGFRLRLALEPAFLLFGLTGVALVYGLQTLALLFTSAANTALISAGVPVAAAVLARVFLKEAIPPVRLFGIVLSVAGIGMVSGATPSGAASGGILLGNALMVGAVLAYGTYAVQGRAFMGIEGYPAVVITTASFAAGLLFLLPLAAGEAILLGAPELRLQGWLIVAYLGVGASALPILLWNYALGHVEAGAAALYINLVPVVGVGTALLFGERVGAAQLVGGTLAILGVLVGDAGASYKRSGGIG